MTREQLAVVLYGGEDYRIYDGQRLVATVYTKADLEWLLDRDTALREQLATTTAHLEAQRTATYQAVEREHAAKQQLATVTQERDQWKREAWIRWCHAQAKKEVQP